MTHPIDAAIQKLNEKITVLTLAKQELEAVRDKTPDAPKAKRGRKARGLPSAMPPPSVANHRQGEGLL